MQIRKIKMPIVCVSFIVMFFMVTSAFADGITLYREAYAARQKAYNANVKNPEILENSKRLGRQLYAKPLARPAAFDEKRDIAGGIMQEAIIHNDKFNFDDPGNKSGSWSDQCEVDGMIGIANNFFLAGEDDLRDVFRQSIGSDSVSRHYAIIKGIRLLSNLYARLLWDQVMTDAEFPDVHESFGFYTGVLNQKKSTLNYEERINSGIRFIEDNMGVAAGLVEQWFIQEWVNLNFGILMEKAAISGGERRDPYWWNAEVYNPSYIERIRRSAAFVYHGGSMPGASHESWDGFSAHDDQPGASHQDWNGVFPGDLAAATRASLEDMRRGLPESQEDIDLQRILRESERVYVQEEQERKKLAEHQAVDEEKRAIEMSLQLEAEAKTLRLQESRAAAERQRQVEAAERDADLVKLESVSIRNASKTYEFDLRSLLVPFKSGNKSEFESEIHQLFDQKSIGANYQQKEKIKRTGLFELTKQATADAALRGFVMDRIIKKLKEFFPESANLWR